MRIRTIKPEFWANEKMARMPDFTRLLAIGLLNFADDHGYFWANPLLIRGALFPFDEDSSKVRRSLAQLAAEGYLKLGNTPDGRECGHITNFSKHQRVDRPKDSEIKGLIKFVEQSSIDRRSIDDESSLEGKGREGKGKEYGAPADAVAPAADLFGSEAPSRPVAPKPERARDPLFDALAAIDGSNPRELPTRAARACGVALAEIRKVAPGLTPEEITRRAANYRAHMPDVTITPNALASHWAKCANPPAGKGGNWNPGLDDDGQPKY